MTPEERERMNELCVQIQEEKNYDQFAIQLRELTDLLARKHQRRFTNHPQLSAPKSPLDDCVAVVNKVIKTGIAPPAGKSRNLHYPGRLSLPRDSHRELHDLSHRRRCSPEGWRQSRCHLRGRRKRHCSK